MSWPAAFLGLALAIGLVGPASAQEETAPADEAQDVAASREILVMLRMPAPHLRPNARYGGRYDDRAAQQARRRVAAQIARENGLELLEGWPMPLIGVDCFVMRVPGDIAIDSVITQISRNRLVAWSQGLNIYETLASARPTDPLYAAQPAASEWHLADLHTLATGRGVTIAVIDSQIETGHPDLLGQFAASRDFLSDRPGGAENHGTGVAGVIGAKADNGIGISGIAPGARLLALRACSERARGNSMASTCDSLTLAKALQFALERGADVINMSLSGPSDRLLASLIGVGLDRHVSVVAAFDPTRSDGGFPASVPGVISVAEESLRSVPAAVYRAPGRDVPTTQPGGRWYLVNGSSFAAAHISGLLALLREEQGATGTLAALARTPAGVVDACGSLVEVSGNCDCSCSLARAGASRGH
jgi:hypothetical protein